MFETQSNNEANDASDVYSSSDVSSNYGNFQYGHVEDQIKCILIKNTESYDGIGDRMIQIVREIFDLFVDLPLEEVNAVYDAIARVMVEFIATQPFKTGIFAGVTTLFSTSLTTGSPSSENSNLTSEILYLSVRRLISELEKSNYYSGQLILNFLTEMANFYSINLSQLVSIYRAFLDTCLSMKRSNPSPLHKYNIYDHYSFVLFTMVAYSLPLIREELRDSQSENQGQSLYNEILRDITLFYDTYIADYCDDVQKVLLNFIGKDLLEIQSVENPFTKYWSDFIQWRDQQCPRIMTIIRFYRSPSISDYIAETVSTQDDFAFGDVLSDIKLGEVNEYLLKQLVRFPSIRSMDIGESLLLRTMDSICEIFAQIPYETARQLLKLPVTTSSYDLCLSITIWNYLLNPFYVTHISYVNSLVINLIGLQSSVLFNIWTPIFILNMQVCGDMVNDDSPKFKEIQDKEPEQGDVSKEQGSTLENSNNPMLEGAINHRIFPQVRNLSAWMILRLKKHIACVFISNEVFRNSIMNDFFWNNSKTDFLFNNEIEDLFLDGILNSVLTEMSRQVLPQTLLSIPNENLSRKISDIPLISQEASKVVVPGIFIELKEFSHLKEIVVFKFSTQDEVIENSDRITEFLKSKIGKLSEVDEKKDDVDEDLEVSLRYEERQNLMDESEEDMNKDQGHDERHISQDTFKSSKKRRVNSVVPQDPFIWTKDSLFDLLLISIIYQGSKSLSHSRRMLANYRTSLLGWYCNNDVTPEISADSLSTASGKSENDFSIQVSQISKGILGCDLFKKSAKLIYSCSENSASEVNGALIYNSHVEAEVRILSTFIAIWGGFLSDPNVCLGYSFQKFKSWVLISTREEVLSPSLVSLILACMLTRIESPTYLDISSNKNRYQIFIDLFELIFETLSFMKVKDVNSESPISEDLDESTKKNPKCSPGVLNCSLEKCVLALICIFNVGSKDFDKRNVDKKLQRLVDDSAAEILLTFGSALLKSEETPGLDLELIQAITGGDPISQIIRDIKERSLEFVMNMNDPSKKAELKWVPSSVIYGKQQTI
ncbi:hypothetical protein OIY81_409 [Cryptosporidium canis]|nr:hypothetical protein OIY81_409 [Cryptosporidium canis]